MKKLIKILPFMDEEELEELAYQIINEEIEGVKLVLLFPFLPKEALDKIVVELINKGDGKQLSMAVPFASKETITKIYTAFQEGTLTGMKEEYLYPFLGQTELKSIFKTLVKQAKDFEDDDETEVHIAFNIDLEDEEEQEVEVEMESLEQEMKILAKRMKKLQK